MLDLPDRLDVRQPDGSVVEDLPMWTYWYLQEGELEIDPASFVTADGRSSPVLHVDSDQPLHDDAGRLITDEPWGVYFKPDRETIQGGAQPLRVGEDFTVDPYPSGSVEPGFADMWSAALSHCLERFASGRKLLPSDPLRRRGRVHRRQLPGVRLHAPERVRRGRLEPRLQDDRRRPRDLARARGRALVAAAPVPVRALRDRGPAPGLALPVPLELDADAGMPPETHARGTRERDPRGCMRKCVSAAIPRLSP